MYFALLLLVLNCASGAIILYNPTPDNEENFKTSTDIVEENIEYEEHYTNMNIDTPEVKLVLKNCELSGIGNCTTNGTTFKLKESYFDQRYWCPSFSIRSDYELNGLIGNVTVNGIGKSLISYYNYDIMLRCYLKNDLTFLNIQYAISDFSLQLKPEGVMLNFSQLNFNNYDKDTNSEENLKILEEIIREPLMRRLVTPYVSRLQLYPVLTTIFNNQSLVDFILEKSILA
ncbi:unnamed protein product [Chrysodeixis includens]|uniref:Uncharacterized protein n=1 Tax=Chrysodeixis includens TaxID=689277 RepID=A0A9P0FTH8_CHRIL|nr:unnamed protein product [Chrysodeixis includens]